MNFVIVILSALALQSGAPPRQSDLMNVSRQTISIVLPNLTLDEALTRVFSSAHLRCRFDSDALAVAMSIRRTANFESVTVNDVLLRLTGSANQAGRMLEIRKQGDEFVIGLPLLDLDISKQSPGYAVGVLMRKCGCDYCAEVTEMGPKLVSIHIKDVPLQEAFKRLMAVVSPKLPYQLTFRHGIYIISRSSSQPRTLIDLLDCDVVASIHSHGRIEAIEAICECLQRGYIIDFDGPLTGTVTVNSRTSKGGQIVRNMLDGTASVLTYIDDGDTIIIVPEATEHGPL